MSHENAEFTIPPLLDKSLSGEFPPRRDPERLRTLGELITATVHEGEIVKHGGGTIRGDSFHSLIHNPLWAPDVKASVFYLKMDERALFRGLVVRRGDEDYVKSRLGFFDGTRQGREQGRLRILRPGSRVDEYYDLTLGDNLTVATQTVTELAQEFFS